MNLFIILAIVVLLYWFSFNQNNHIVVSNYTLPAEMDGGLTIAHLSDLHTKRFGRKNEKLFAELRRLQPDLIVMTGDIVDRWNDRVPAYIDELSALDQIAPTFDVPGNHETTSDHWEEIRDLLRQARVRVLDNDVALFTKGGARLALLGCNNSAEVDDQALYARLNEIGGYRILLDHYPMAFFKRSERAFDAQLSGHAHGGQIRLPFIGGLFSPDQGILPKYDAGVYVFDGKRLVVSRGLGNSEFPQRIGNRPEIVCISIGRFN